MFAALEETVRLDENAMILVFTDGRTNMSGLCEGVKTAVRQKHRVIIVILSDVDLAYSSESLSRLREIGVGVAKCQPRDIWGAVNSEIIAMSQRRQV